MSRTRYSKRLILCAPALAFLAGAAHAQSLAVTPSPTVPLTYVKGADGTAPTATVTVTGASDDTIYTVSQVPGASWLTSACSACVAGTGAQGDSNTGAATDTVTLTLVESAADKLTATTAGTVYTATVNLMVGTTVAGSITVNLTLTASASPLTTSPSTISLTYILNGVANQPAAKTTATVSDTDTVADTYTISGAPAWLSVVATHGSASATATDTLTFSIIQSAANSTLTQSPSAQTVNLVVSGNANYPITVNLTLIPQQPLIDSNAYAFTYTIGATNAPGADSSTITVASGSIGFSLDPSTVPTWLTATASGTANTSGAAVSLTPVAAVVKGLAAGNYTASVGYEATGALHELLIPVTLTVSNPTATVSIKGTATNTAILNYPGAVTPVPVVTVLSSDEPTGFTATCAVVSTYAAYVQSQAPCTMSGASSPAASVTGIAYTYGTPLTITFDPALFLTPGQTGGTPFGTAVTVTVSVVAGSQSAVTQSYAYTLEPIAPAFTALSPTSAAQITSNSLVVTLTGTNFVSPDHILGTTISATKVFVGTTDVSADAVVVSPSTIMVSVPFGDFPNLGTAKTAPMIIGVANQTGSSAPAAATATQTLTVTTNPVIYAVTSTATYLQPSPGSRPSVAPFELVSIFGAQFGVTSSVTGPLSSYEQFPTAVTISGSGTSAVTLSVTFKVGSNTYKAPILFANSTQINCLVPSQLTSGQTASVTVTSGANVSDGLFTVGVVAAQPGIFTLGADGIGQGAILNADYSVNGPGNGAAAGSIVSIYATGLGFPNSTGADISTDSATTYPTACVAVTDASTTSPGYLQVANTTKGSYTAPSPAWTNIDGAVIQEQLMGTSSLFAPCFVNSGTTAITVTIGSTAINTTGATGISYAGFVIGSVAGLYQINVAVPEGLAAGTYAVTLGIGTQTSPAGVVNMTVVAAQ